MINRQTIEQFQKELSSKSPTPGGGVVAALAAQFSASLIEMVCNLTKGDGLLGIEHRAREIKKRLVRLADEDARAFQKVMEAYRKKPRSKSMIVKTLKYAIEVPMEVKKLSKELEILGAKTAKAGNKNAVSDAKAAVHLAHAAGKAAQENIKINKVSLAALK